MKIRGVIILIIIIFMVFITHIYLQDKKKIAENIILSDANVLYNDININVSKIKFKNFRFIYEMDFTYKKVNYNYQVNLFTDEIINQNQKNKKVNSNDLSIYDKIKNIALTDARVPSNLEDVIIKELEDDGKLVYKVEFSFDQIKYQYIISKKGEIINKTKEVVDNVIN